jgi:hypothetical protein
VLRLQRAIMPEDEPPVEAAGVDVAVRYRPAEQGRLVAGDWYDALLLPDSCHPEGRPPYLPRPALAGPDAASHADRILARATSDTGDDACLVAVRIR